jgi:hypothetical protein
MLVPETSVNENNSFVLGQYYIGTAREILSMETKPQPHRVQFSSNHELWIGVTTFDRSHVLTSLLRANSIHNKVRKRTLGISA